MSFDVKCFRIPVQKEQTTFLSLANYTQKIEVLGVNDKLLIFCEKFILVVVTKPGKIKVYSKSDAHMKTPHASALSTIRSSDRTVPDLQPVVNKRQNIDVRTQDPICF